MRWVTDDLWEGRADWRVITTNLCTRRDGAAVMGRGVARQAADRFPTLPVFYGHALRQRYHGLVPFTEFGVLCLPVKRHWSDTADLGIIGASLTELAEFAAERSEEIVRMPVPGVGFGEADPAAITHLLQIHLGGSDNVVVVARAAGVAARYPGSFRAGARRDRS